MDHGFGIRNRRTFLAGALGTAGLVVAGCNSPTASDLAPSHPISDQLPRRGAAARGQRINDSRATAATPTQWH